MSQLLMQAEFIRIYLSSIVFVLLVRIGMIAEIELVFLIWLFLLEICSSGSLLPDLAEGHMDPKTAVTEE